MSTSTCNSGAYMKHSSCTKPLNGIFLFHSTLYVSLMILFSAQVMAVDWNELYNVICSIYFKNDPQRSTLDINSLFNTAKEIMETPEIIEWLKAKALEINSSGRKISECVDEFQKEFFDLMQNIRAKKAAAAQYQTANSDRGVYTMGGQNPMYSNIYQNPSNTYGANPYYNQPNQYPGFTSSQNSNMREGYQQERQRTSMNEANTPGYGASYRSQSGYQKERYDSQPSQPHPSHPGPNLGQDNTAAKANAYYGSHVNYGQAQMNPNQYTNMGQAQYTGQTQDVGQTQGHYGTGRNQYSSVQGQNYFGQDSGTGQNQNTYNPYLYRTGETQQSPYNSWQYQNPGGYGQTNYQGQYNKDVYKDQNEVTSTTEKPKHILNNVFNFVNKKLF